MKKKILNIKWQRLVVKGKTCPRCKGTEKEINKAIATLRKLLIPLGVKVSLKKEGLSLAEFKKNPLKSNRLWINNRPIEDYLKGEVGQSSCCEVCGTEECRTIKVEKEEYEIIPSVLIIKAGLDAVHNWLGKNKIKKE
ncbi:MAG: DUF2703 domain-containing protein [candidate division WOR-3 bacterium]